jgi:hypothetical protein
VLLEFLNVLEECYLEFVIYLFVKHNSNNKMAPFFLFRMCPRVGDDSFRLLLFGFNALLYFSSCSDCICKAKPIRILLLIVG